MSVESASLEGEDGIAVPTAVPQITNGRHQGLAGLLDDRHGDDDLVPGSVTTINLRRA